MFIDLKMGLSKREATAIEVKGRYIGGVCGKKAEIIKILKLRRETKMAMYH